jgi:exodeoxyribonuclease V alpha subunit
MRISDVVEIIKVWPSPLGGAVFKCVKPGDSRVFSCQASHKVLSRIPKVAEFWEISGDLIETQKYGVVCDVVTATITDMPSDE